MIEHLAYEKLDRSLYDQCVLRSEHFRIYATSWYLDAVTERWDVLVYGNYEAVMPLPRRRKYGLAYVYPPPWIQQLGIFSTKPMTDKQEEAFYKKASSTYFLVDYSLHSGSRVTKGCEKRTNYVIKLNKSYNEIQKSFKSNRKKTLKGRFEGLELDKNGDTTRFLRAYATTPKAYEVSDNALRSLERLIHSNTQQIKVWNVLHGKEWIGGLVWSIDQYRITYLVQVTTEYGRSREIGSMLVDELIRDNQNSARLLDFEGSMLPGVANFFRSFGAEKEIYYFFKKRVYGLY